MPKAGWSDVPIPRLRLISLFLSLYIVFFFYERCYFIGVYEEITRHTSGVFIIIIYVYFIRALQSMVVPCFFLVCAIEIFCYVIFKIALYIVICISYYIMTITFKYG